MNQEGSKYFEDRVIGVDIEKNIFGPKYEGNPKYPFFVYEEPNLTHAYIDEIRQYVEEVRKMTSDEYEAKVRNGLYKFAASEGGSVLSTVPKLAKWIFRRAFIVPQDGLTDEDKKIAKAIILAVDDSHTSLPILGDDIGAVRSAAHEKSDIITKWLDIATKVANTSLMNKEIGTMTGLEFKAYLTYLGLI